MTIAAENRTIVTWVILLLTAIIIMIVASTFLNQPWSTNQFVAVASPTPVATPNVSPIVSPTISDNFLTSLQSEIVMIQKSLDDDINQENLGMEITQLRRRVANAYDTVDTNTQTELQKLDNQLAVIEKEAEVSVAQALQTFQRLTDDLEEDIRRKRAADEFNNLNNEGS